MNKFVLLKGNNDIEKDIYNIVFLLVLFLICRVLDICLYYFGRGGNFYFILKPLIFYIIYFFILFIFNRKDLNYNLISSLIIGFIIPINTSLFIFSLFSIVGNIICYIFKYKMNNIVVCSLMIFCYLSFMGIGITDIYTSFFYYGYIFLCIFSLIYLYFNRLIKITAFIICLIGILLFNIISDGVILDISFFYLLFIVLDNRYSPITKMGQVIGGVIFFVLLFVFGIILKLDYYLLPTIYGYELGSYFINIMGIGQVYKFFLRRYRESK